MARFSLIALASVIFSASNVSASPFNTHPVQSNRNVKSTHVARLLSKARPTQRSQLKRRLDEEEQIDLSGYSIQFVKCQFVKSYNDELAEDEDAETVLATSRFVIFRLCPSDSCTYNYGEYLVDMDAYLESAVEFHQEQQEEMCNYCGEVCAADDDGGEDEDEDGDEDGEEDGDEDGDEDEDEDEDGGRKLRKLRKLEQSISCDTCTNECEKIENMEDNGYVEASNYVQCQQISEEDDGTAFYAGAMCASSGAKIKIGVFSDEDCSQAESSLSVEDYLDAKLSHALMKNVYSSSSYSCVKPNWEVPEDDDAAEDEEEEEEEEMNEMCQNLYQDAGKCESLHGFADTYSNYEGYDNQAAQEELVCSFIKTMKKGAYDETGDIVLQGKVTSVEGATAATGGQRFLLTVFILGTAGLAYHAASLHALLTKGGANGLRTQGGAMA